MRVFAVFGFVMLAACNSASPISTPLEPELAALSPAVRAHVASVVDRTAVMVRKAGTPEERLRLRREALEQLSIELAAQPIEAQAALRQQLFGDEQAIADIESATAALATRQSSEETP